MKFFKVSKLLREDLVLCEVCLAVCSGMLDYEDKLIHYCWRETNKDEPKKCEFCGETE